MSGVEALSNIMGIIAFSTKFAKICVEFSQEVHGLAQHIRLFRDTLQTLCDTLTQILALKTEEMTQAEEELLEIVERGSGCCYSLIQSLENKIPELQGNPNVLKRTKTALELKFHDHDIQEKIDGIKAYSGSIQLSLSALTIKKIIKFDGHMHQIGRLLERLNTQPFPLAQYHPIGLEIGSPESPAIHNDRPQRQTSRDSSLHLQSWDSSSTAPSFSAKWSSKIKEVTSQATPSPSVGGSESCGSSSISSGISDTGSEPPMDDVTQGIFKEMLSVSEKNVKELTEKGCFLRAARHQDQSIRWCKMLTSSQQVPFNEKPDMLEEKAELLLKCSTTACWNEALETLCELLKLTDRPHNADQNHVRMGRVHLQVARLFSQPNRISERNRHKLEDFHSELAFRYLASEQLPVLPPELEHAANLRTEILRRNGSVVEAEGVERFLALRRERTPSTDASIPQTESPRPDTDSLSSRSSCFEDTTAMSETAALDWCRDTLRCDSYSESFKFEAPLADGSSPLYRAIQEDQVSVVKQMCAEADLGSEEAGLALITAAKQRSQTMAEILLHHESPIDQRDTDGGTVLHACQNDSKHGVGIAKFFLKQREDTMNEFINRQDNKGRTALFLACENGHQRMVTTLLKHGANPKLRDSTRISCLHLAVEVRNPATVATMKGTTRRPSVQSNGTSCSGQNKRAEMLQLLLDKGADVNVKNNYDETPLHRACILNYRDAVEVLLDAGADVNGRALDGETPLIAAARRHQASMARLLIRKGGDPWLRDQQGHDAFYYASGPVGVRVLQALQASQRH